jgi:hypothetical protein
MASPSQQSRSYKLICSYLIEDTVLKTPNSLKELSPASYNPRTISPLQKAALKRSYERYGDLSGIVYNEVTGNLVGGHQRQNLFHKRTRIISKPQKDSVGTTAVGHVVVTLDNGREIKIPYRQVNFSGEVEMAANIAANSAGGEFDQKKLGYVLHKLEKKKFAVEDVPLNNNEWRAAVRAFEVQQEKEEIKKKEGTWKIGDPPKTSINDGLTKAEQAVLRKAWYKLTAEWAHHMKIVPKLRAPTPNITKGGLVVHFVEALQTGSRIPRLATTAYVPHRLFTAGDKYSVAELFPACLKDPSLLDSFIWYAKANGGPNLDRYLAGTLPIHGYRAPADFPVELALSLIEEFTRRGAKVLDPCHGWGGRMLGFMLSRRASEYCGFDVDPKTHAGVKEMYTDLVPFAGMPKKAVLKLCPFEKSSLPANYFDFALTSPPYYDTEKYNGDESSWKKYKAQGFDGWVKGFYAPMIAKTARALKPGAVFCLQVGSQIYPLEPKAREIAPKYGFKHIETRSTDLVNNYTGTDRMKGEVVVVLKKVEK